MKNIENFCFLFYSAPKSIFQIYLNSIWVTAGIEPATLQYIPGALAYWATTVTSIMEKIKMKIFSDNAFVDFFRYFSQIRFSII